jgi:hypothetical protein
MTENTFHAFPCFDDVPSDKQSKALPTIEGLAEGYSSAFWHLLPEEASYEEFSEHLQDVLLKAIRQGVGVGYVLAKEETRA